ncbi:unnamed protein product [Cuscuta epithymum]|uniref:Pentatricopeptide repeat-containing protein n=1 Tax=Cuscuta epithymum TaxID=186058 RepID=A0AAV0D4S2_9ASTE|nr:unnamed protein product [Cuscuta epithymum]
MEGCHCLFRNGLVQIVVTYTALAELDMVPELLQEMCEKGLELNIYTYSSLINGFCKDGNISQALKVMIEWEAFDMLPDCFTHTTLMDAYCKSGEMEKAHLEEGREIQGWMMDKGTSSFT